jgi:tetratricopeptide (TPR) repeat protein
MERPKYQLIILWLLLLPLASIAGNKSAIYKAYISNDMAGWKRTIDAMQAEKNKTSPFLLELVNYQYGYIGWCIGADRKDEASKILGLAENNLEILENRSYRVSYLNSYKSAFYGFRIGLNVLKAPFIGPKSVSAAELAMKQDSTNPFGFIQYANSQYYMPAAFGGSKTLAIRYYQKAEKIMKANPAYLKEDWNYLSLLSIIGKAMEETGNLRAARQYYERILKLEPNFLWVKNDLYPNLLKKMK